MRAAFLGLGLVMGACSLSLDPSLIPHDAGKGSGGTTGSDASDAAREGDAPSEACSKPDCGTPSDTGSPDVSDLDVSDAKDGSACTISGLAQACAACGEVYCCSQWNACASDTQCIELGACMNANCAADQTTTCAQQYCTDSGNLDTYFKLFDCFSTNCQTECGGGG